MTLTLNRCVRHRDTSQKSLHSFEGEYRGRFIILEFYLFKVSQNVKVLNMDVTLNGVTYCYMTNENNKIIFRKSLDDQDTFERCTEEEKNLIRTWRMRAGQDLSYSIWGSLKSD